MTIFFSTPTATATFTVLFLLLHIPHLTTAADINPQGQTLLSWKTTLLNPNALPDWNPADSTPCQWSGISCNATGRVTELTLQYIDLHSTIPANLTKLSGPIPSQLSHQLPCST